jgi:hypothetical protein
MSKSLVAAIAAAGLIAGTIDVSAQGTQSPGSGSAPQQEGQKAAPQKEGQKAAPEREGQKATPQQEGQKATPQQEGQKTTPQREGATQEGRTGGAGAELSTEQRTEVRQTILQSGNVPRVSRSEVNINISVGTVVPRSVRLVSIPERIVTIRPAWRGFLYFVVEDEIIVVEPGSLKIVAVISA